MTSDFIGAVAPDSLVVQLPDLLFLEGGEGERVTGGEKRW